MSAYRKDFDETKYMFFFIKDDELLRKYNDISEKVKNVINKEFDSEFDSIWYIMKNFKAKNKIL